MAKLVKISISLVYIIILLNLAFSQVIINEIELNPEGDDSGEEWVELYSNQAISLLGWKLKNADNQEILLNQTINGYLVINFKTQWLDNDNESVRLYNSEQLIDFSPILKDSSNNNKAWSRCNNHWILSDSSPGYSNNCIQNINNTPSNNTNNSTNNPNVPVIPYKYEIELKLDWDDNDIKNGEEFEVEVKALNLENKKYDLKVYIYDESKTRPLSQTKDPEEGWVSSNLYMKEFFSGPGNETENVKLRIREPYRNFSGNVNIGVRLRESETTKFIKEIDDEILIKKASNVKTSDTESSEDNSLDNYNENEINNIENIEYNEPAITGNVINLDMPKTQAIKTKDNVIYQSKNELIKLYSIYALIILCILFLVLLVLKILT